ncbi:MAG TPA: hypothetical protein VHY20_06840 [Pirellulales bacterium]|nr:hypothetical protein [Pirellulales bacterium]
MRATEAADNRSLCRRPPSGFARLVHFLFAAGQTAGAAAMLIFTDMPRSRQPFHVLSVECVHDEFRRALQKTNRHQNGNEIVLLSVDTLPQRPESIAAAK